MTASAEYLAPDANLSDAIATRDSFFAYAPLGWRGDVRRTLRWLAYEQGRTVSVTAAWGYYAEHNGADYFYVLVGPARALDRSLVDALPDLSAGLGLGVPAEMEGE